MTIEYEARFLEIDKIILIEKLRTLGATDKGEAFLKETIFYDTAGTWQEDGKLVRVRTINDSQTAVTFKHHRSQAVDGAYEAEFSTSDGKPVEEFLAQIGLVASRWQEKTRHTFLLDDVTIDIDTWPRIPTYLEIEGSSEHQIKQAAQKLGLDWQDAVFEDARNILENRYNIPIREITYFTFDKVE